MSFSITLLFALKFTSLPVERKKCEVDSEIETIVGFDVVHLIFLSPTLHYVCRNNRV